MIYCLLANTAHSTDLISKHTEHTALLTAGQKKILDEQHIRPQQAHAVDTSRHSNRRRALCTNAHWPAFREKIILSEKNLF